MLICAVLEKETGRIKVTAVAMMAVIRKTVMMIALRMRMMRQ